MWRITLREGLRFHDGSPVLARDAVASIRRWGMRDAFGQPCQDTVLMPGELILAVRLPPDTARFAGNFHYVKLRERTSYAFAVVSAAAALRLDGSVVAEARIALGGVAAKPWRCPEAERLLVGRLTIIANALRVAGRIKARLG